MTRALVFVKGGVALFALALVVALVEGARGNGQLSPAGRDVARLAIAAGLAAFVAAGVAAVWSLS